MNGSMKATKLGKRPDTGTSRATSASPLGGLSSSKSMSNVSGTGTGAAGSASTRKSAFSVSGGGMVTKKGK